MAEGDVLDTNTPPVVVPPVGPPRKKFVCEFCECQLAPSGEVMCLGEKAKRFRQHEEVMERKDAEIRKLNEEISALKAERDALKGSTKGSGSHRVGARVL